MTVRKFAQFLASAGHSLTVAVLMGVTGGSLMVAVLVGVAGRSLTVAVLMGTAGLRAVIRSGARATGAGEAI